MTSADANDDAKTRDKLEVEGGANHLVRYVKKNIGAPSSFSSSFFALQQFYETNDTLTKPVCVSSLLRHTHAVTVAISNNELYNIYQQVGANGK